jgi:DDE superfamily endonuclease
VGVFLAYASRHGHALIDRELYLPQSWAEDPGRRLAAGIPEEVEFPTKPRQAQAMISRAIAAGVPFAWFTADEAYGQAKYLQAWLEECFQQAKGEAGLDHYQVRSWRAWYAHITLSMLALAWLAASRAQAQKLGIGTSDPSMTGYTLTLPEIRRLLIPHQLDPAVRTRSRGRPGGYIGRYTRTDSKVAVFSGGACHENTVASPEPCGAERGRRPSQQVRRSAVHPARTPRADPLVASRWRAAHGHRCHAARTDHKGALAACLPAYRRDTHRHRCHDAQSPRLLPRTAGRPLRHAERTKVKQRRVLDPVRRQMAAFLKRLVAGETGSHGTAVRF